MTNDKLRTSDRPRTTISTANMPAVQAPPTKIIESQMCLDPKKVIEAWLQSAEVLKTVAAAAIETQEDNAYTRDVVTHTQKVFIRVGIVITVLQSVSVLLHLL